MQDSRAAGAPGLQSRGDDRRLSHTGEMMEAVPGVLPAVTAAIHTSVL